MLLSLIKAIGYTFSPLFIFLYKFIFRRPSPKPSFKDDIVLVTGGAQGLGKELALEFCNLGGVIVLWDLNETKLEETRAEIASKGCEVFTYVVDCTNKEAVYRTAKRVKDEVGDVSVLVNNAGVLHTGGILELPEHKIEQTYSVNTLSHYWLIRSFLPWMIHNDYGYIVNITSIAAFSGSPGAVAYCSSKSAALSLCESLRLQLHKLNKKGVSVTGVCPWHIADTNLFQQSDFKTALHWLVPALKPKDVAVKVAKAVYERTFCLLLPFSLHFMIMLKFLLPSKASNELFDIIGDGFITRNDDN